MNDGVALEGRPDEEDDAQQRKVEQYYGCDDHGQDGHELEQRRQGEEEEDDGGSVRSYPSEGGDADREAPERWDGQDSEPRGAAVSKQFEPAEEMPYNRDEDADVGEPVEEVHHVQGELEAEAAGDEVLGG